MTLGSALKLAVTKIFFCKMKIIKMLTYRLLGGLSKLTYVKFLQPCLTESASINILGRVDVMCRVKYQMKGNRDI